MSFGVISIVSTGLVMLVRFAFEHKRFCETEGIENVVTLSDYKNDNFGDAWQTRITDGLLEGLHSRCVVVIDENGYV